MLLSKFKIVAFIILTIAMVACGGSKTPKVKKLEVPTSPLLTESDSLAYIMGVSMARNLREMDSLVDLKVVAAAIAQYGTPEAVLTQESARDAYFRYLYYIDPERRRGYEDQYLAELALEDRSYTRTRTGLTYQILEVGDEKNIPRSNVDWVVIDYTISRIDDSGEELFSTYTTEEPLKSGIGSLPKGLSESVKLIGKGGKISALIPSKLAFDREGCDSLAIKPFETLLYQIELVNVEKGAASKYTTVTRDPSTF